MRLVPLPVTLGATTRTYGQRSPNACQTGAERAVTLVQTALLKFEGRVNGHRNTRGN